MILRHHIVPVLDKLLLPTTTISFVTAAAFCEVSSHEISGTLEILFAFYSFGS